MSNAGTGALAQTNTLANKTNVETLRTNSSLFTEEVVNQVGDTVPDTSDYAIVVVSIPYKLATGEGSDRMDMSLGKENYELIDNVANKYPGKTIVVLRANYPMEMERVQNNPKVAGVVFQAYAGQYDGYALGQILFGDATPTGRLSSTWYKSMDSLPKISKYVVGNGIYRNVGGSGISLVTFDKISPKYTVDMVKGDPYETGLTYMFAGTKDVTYEFGYGLSYSDFSYSKFQAPESVGTEPFEVTVDVTNTGAVDTAEVVQVYIAENNPAYGDYASKKKLVSFEKVWIGAGETETVTLKIDPADFAVWNTNAGDFTVLSGEYTLSLGRSSNDFKFTKNINVNAGEIGLLDISKPVNIFNRTFASNELAYSEISQQNSIDALKNKELFDSQYAIKSKGAGSWAAMKNANLTGVTKLTFSVASQFEAGSFEVRLDSPDGALLTTLDVPKTEPETTYLRDSGGVRMYSGHSTNDWAYPGVAATELQYVDVEAAVSNSVAGIHDLYLVFNAPDLRVATAQFEVNLPAPVVTVSVTTPTLVETMAANLAVTAVGENLEGRTLTATLTVGEKPYSVVLEDGKGILRIDQDTNFTKGLYKVVVTVSDSAVTGECDIDVVAYNENIWTCSTRELDGKFLIVFNAEVELKSTGSSATIDGKTYSVKVNDTYTIEVLDFDPSAPRASDTFIIKGVKYPILFPSYSFTFTSTIS